MDDPIFDPWPIEEAGPGADAEASRPPETATPTGTPTTPPPTAPPSTTPTPTTPTPAAPPSRWRSTATRDVPAKRPAPAPEPRGEAAAVDTEPRTSPKAGRPREGLPLRPPSPPVREPGPPASAPRTAAPDPVAERLRAIALPRLEALATRLEVARHRTLLDDRLDRAEPMLRFRLMPWRAPFEVAGAVPGSVLELLVDRTKGSRVAARFWLDPLATTPAEETLIDARRLTDAWLEGVLLDFVGRALGRL